LRFAVREPGEYGRSRESPLFPETPAGQFALLRARPHGVGWDLEKRGNLLQGEYLAARSGRTGDLDPANGKRLCSRQPVSEELTDQGLFTTSGRFGQAVEGRRLVVRQPHE